MGSGGSSSAAINCLKRKAMILGKDRLSTGCGSDLGYPEHEAQA